MLQSAIHGDRFEMAGRTGSLRATKLNLFCFFWINIVTLIKNMAHLHCTLKTFFELLPEI